MINIQSTASSSLPSTTLQSGATHAAINIDARPLLAQKFEGGTLSSAFRSTYRTPRSFPPLHCWAKNGLVLNSTCFNEIGLSAASSIRKSNFTRTMFFNGGARPQKNAEDEEMNVNGDPGGGDGGHVVEGANGTAQDGRRGLRERQRGGGGGVRQRRPPRAATGTAAFTYCYIC